MHWNTACSWREGHKTQYEEELRDFRLTEIQRPSYSPFGLLNITEQARWVCVCPAVSHSSANVVSAAGCDY